MTRRCQREAGPAKRTARTCVPKHITACVTAASTLNFYYTSPLTALHTHTRSMRAESSLSNMHPPFSEIGSGRLTTLTGRHGERRRSGDEGTLDSVGSGHVGQHSRNGQTDRGKARRTTRKQRLQRLQGTRHLMRPRRTLSYTHTRTHTYKHTRSRTTPPTLD